MIRINEGQRNSYIKILSGDLINFSDILINGNKYKIMNMRREKSEDTQTQLAEKGYDIQIEVKKLQECYVQMYNRK